MTDRCTKILLRIALSTALVLGIPLGAFPSAEAQAICAERMPTADHGQNTSANDTKAADSVRAEATRSPTQEIHAGHQNALDCLLGCLEDTPNGYLALVNTAESEKLKKYTLVSLIDQLKPRSVVIGSVSRRSSTTPQEDILPRTMRWRT
jgi:hypothetical protein